MEAVLSTPELIDMIFAYTTRKDNATTALVCKKWLEISRDHIWFTVAAPYELFSLLAPLTSGDNKKRNFTRLPTTEDWERFRPFARRVRRLIVNKLENFSPRMAATLLRSSCRPDRLLPNLRTLEWSLRHPDTWRQSVHILFLHPGVRRLGLYNVSREWKEGSFCPLPELALEITRIAPSLTELEVKALSRNSPTLEAAILTLLSRLPSLQQLGLIPFLLTVPVLQSLSRLEHLEDLMHTLPKSQWHRGHACDPYDSAPFKHPIVLTEGAFRSLQTLCFAAPIESATLFLADKNFPALRLKVLEIRVLDVVTNTRVLELLQVIASRCPNITKLALSLYPPKFAIQGLIDPVVESLDAATLQPLRELGKLESLIVNHTSYVSLSELELLQLMDDLKRITNLHLVSQPDWLPGASRHPPPSTFGWDTLTQITAKFPQIRSLSLYFDFSLPSLPATIGTLALPARTLDLLDVGTSAFPQSMAKPTVAYKLGGHLREGAELGWGMPTGARSEVALPIYSEPGFSSQLEPWKDVEKLLYFGLSMRDGVYRGAELAALSP